VKFAAQPADLFNDAAAPRALREALKRERVGQSACAHVWRVLSAVLSWAAQSELVPEIQTNGALLASEKVGNRRKSVRGRHGRGSVRRRGEEVRSWALAPLAVELIRAQMLARAADARRPLIAYRDATLLYIQFGLGMRNQEVYGIRWSALERERAHVLECGYRTRGVDFVIPGDLAGDHGICDPRTGACHMSGNQAKKWGLRYMTPAINALAQSDARYANLRGAAPYALRRGGISMRLRSEDARSVAEQCGTSLEMLSQHYSYEIDDYSHLGPQSVDEQWRNAQAAAQTRIAETQGGRHREAAA
jgi:integrase